MDRRTRNLFLVALVVVVGLTAAAAFLLGGSAVRIRTRPPARRRRSVSSSASSRQAWTEVNGFDLRTTDQGTLDFKLGDLDNGAEFPPGHLVEHQSTAQPVRVWYRTEDGVRVAVRLEDAT